MAVNNTAKAYSNMEFPLSMKRQDAFALDPTCVWPSLAEAQNYAKTNPTAYIGQVLSVVLMVRLPHTPSRTLLAISPLWALPQLILRPIPK